MECSISGCDRTARYVSTGWCQTHYHRYWRTGTTGLLKHAPRDDLTYYGAHGRVKILWGSATKYVCAECARPADEWAYDGTDPSELRGSVVGYPVVYSVWPEFYMPLCLPCHRLRDASARAQRRTHCRRGHELTEENTYRPPGGRNERECRVCRNANYRARRARN